MTFQDQLQPKVAEIERLALESYDVYLDARSLKVDGDGNIVLDSASEVPVPSELDLEAEQRAYNDCLSLLASVKARFELYYYLDPAPLAVTVMNLGGDRVGPAPATAPTKVFDRLHYAEERWVDPVTGMIDEDEWLDPADWSGTAAETFYNDFLTPFSRAAGTQMAWTAVLSITAQAVHDGIDKAQDDLLAIADAGIAEFRGEGDANWGAFFLSASLFLGAVGLFPLSAEAALTVGTGGVAVDVVDLVRGWVSDNADADDGAEWQVRGSNGPQILESIWQCLLDLDALIERKDKELAEALERDFGGPDGRRGPRESSRFDKSELELPPPPMDGPEDFGTHVAGTVVPGVPTARNEVVVTVVRLYEAGHINLPSAAYQYEQAATMLSTPIPNSFTRLFFRAASAFQQARSHLRGAVSDIRWHLTNAGQVLVQIAQDYEKTDEQSAEILRQIGELPPPELSDPPPWAP